MHQFAVDARPELPQAGLTYLESCTTVAPTRTHADLIAEIAALMRTALDSTDTRSLRHCIGAARAQSSDIDDIVSAAGHVVVDDLMRTGVPAIMLEPLFVQLAGIERELCASPVPTVLR